jgi:UDP-GlcNAc:undecaprenyl-phosphate GlcNAc-1-phosphate transferase
MANRAGIVAAIAFGVALALTWAVRWWGRRAALLDGAGATGHAKPAVRAVPNIGGIAIFWAIAVAALWGMSGASDGGWSGTGVRELAVVLGAALGLHVVGLIDDRRPLGPVPKLVAQVIAGLVPPMVLGVRSLELLDAHVGGPWLSIVITAAWFVAVTNALNFMDNMDGIAASTAGIAAAVIGVIALTHDPDSVAILSAAMVGACAGFLVFNGPRPGGGRATIFMGDGGSLVAGYLLAYATVRVTYVAEAQTAHLAAVFVPVCVLAIPLYDLVAVSVIRIAQGKSPMVGDQQHFTHRLRKRGLSDGRVCAVVAGCVAITGLAGLALTRMDGWWPVVVAGQVGLMVVVIALFERGSSKGRAGG